MGKTLVLDAYAKDEEDQEAFTEKQEQADDQRTIWRHFPCTGKEKHL